MVTTRRTLLCSGTWSVLPTLLAGVPTTVLLLGGCQLLSDVAGSPDEQFPRAVGAFSYQPLNPLSVLIASGETDSHDGISATHYREAFLTDFCNDATRVATATMNARGTLSYGPVGATSTGQTYSMVIDYIKYMTVSVPVRVFEARTAAVPPKIGGVVVNDRDARVRAGHVDRDSNIPAKVRYITMVASPSAADDENLLRNGEVGPDRTIRARVTKDEAVREIFAGSMPIYVGVGLRVRADFKSLQGDVKLSGLPGLSAEASAGRISGTLSVQTMGIGGPEITPLMPIPSDLSVASIQSAVQAAASIKVKMYDPKTIVQPMIVGFESPVTEGDVVAELTSFIYSRDIQVALKLSSAESPGDSDLLWLKWTPQPAASGSASKAATPGSSKATPQPVTDDLSKPPQ